MIRGTAAGGERLWGWWLRAHGDFIEDEEGRRWPSVLEAFWRGHLGFPASAFERELSEQLLRVLAAIERRPLTPPESMHDLFGGDLSFRRFYMGWLCSVGLAESDGSPLDARITEAGRSVLRLLEVTREPEWIDLPFTSVTALAARGGPEEADREAVLRVFEAEAAARRYVFARETVHRMPAVTLTGMVEEGRVPMKRVIWSVTFAGADARDNFFAWLAERVDRWDDWGGKAYRWGGAALTQHLFAMLASANV